MTELAWRLWHRVRWGHPYYTTRTGPFDHRKPCYRCEESQPLTAPRTDPQSTVSVEPLTEAGKVLLHEHSSGTPHMARHIGAIEREASHDALRFINYLWTATGRDPNVHVCDLFDKSDPIFDDIERFGVAFRSALPVREDEPTGIDVEALARALAKEYGARIVGAAERVAAEYDRLTREASHVR